MRTNKTVYLVRVDRAMWTWLYSAHICQHIVFRISYDFNELFDSWGHASCECDVMCLCDVINWHITTSAAFEWERGRQVVYRSQRCALEGHNPALHLRILSKHVNKFIKQHLTNNMRRASLKTTKLEKQVWFCNSSEHEKQTHQYVGISRYQQYW